MGIFTKIFFKAEGVNFYARAIKAFVIGTIFLIAGIALAIWGHEPKALLLSLLGLIVSISGFILRKRAKAVMSGDSKRVFY